MVQMQLLAAERLLRVPGLAPVVEECNVVEAVDVDVGILVVEMKK